MHRRVYIVLFIAVFASTMGVGFIGPLLPLYARDLGAAGLTLGMLFAGYSVARVVFMPFIGRLSDKRGRRSFLVAGLAFYTVFSLAYISANTIGHLIVVRALHGASAGMVIPIAQAYIGDLSPKGREGSYMGTFMVSLFAAFGLGPLLGGALADRFGMHAPFYVMGVLSAVALLLILIFLPELGLHGVSEERRSPVRAVIGDTVIVAVILFRTVVAFGRGLVIPFLPFVAESRGASLSTIGFLLATNILLSAFLQVPFGRLADRMSKPLLISLGIVGSAGVIFAIPYCRTVGALFGVQAATGVFSALGFPAGLAMAAQAGKRFHAMGTVMSLFNSGMSIGLIVGPLGGGLLADALGLDFVFKGGSLVVAAGFVVFLMLIRRAAVEGVLPKSDGLPWRRASLAAERSGCCERPDACYDPVVRKESTR
jgi:DHA1 family multidrug resistance protein-like MFS transporter